MKTLIVISHPYPKQSHVIKSLEQAVKTLPDVTVRNLESLYGQNLNGFNIQAEQAAHDEADRVIYMFPVHWFNLTPMLKAYMNSVWAYGWAFGPEGIALKGKQFQVVATAGATEFTYSEAGIIECSMDEVLSPLKASAKYVGMNYLQPIAFFEAMGANEIKIKLFQDTLITSLSK